MPQQPAALLPDAGVSPGRSPKNMPAPVAGEGGGPRESRFGEALRQSRAAMNETPSPGGAMDEGGKETSAGALPLAGKTLPPETGAAGTALDLEADLLAGGGSEEGLDDTGGDGPTPVVVALAPNAGEALRPLSVEETPAPGVAVPEPSAIHGVAEGQRELAGAVAPVAGALRAEGRHPGGNADGNPGPVGQRMIEVALAGRPGEGPPAARSGVPSDEGAIQMRDASPAMREIAMENARRAQSFGDEPGARLTAEAVGRFANVAGLTQAEGIPQSSPIANPQALAQPATDRGTMTVSLPMETPLQSREWKEEFGERVRWLIGQKMQTAELKINPPHLGSVDIRIQVQNDQVSVQFQAAHAMVRDALEDSLPRLREILGNSGLDLVDVDVAQHPGTGGGEAGTEPDGEGEGRAHDSMLSQEESGEAPLDGDAILRQGMVDIYA